MKLGRAVRTRRGRAGLRLGVAAAGTHQPLLRRLAPATVIDVGANRGQFALDVEAALPAARVISFDPMPDAVAIHRRLFAGNPRVTVRPVALGSAPGTATLHRSGRDDSSSLLPIGEAQTALFPGTEERGTEPIAVTTLDLALADEVLAGPVLCKLDVQGFELEVLRGATDTLTRVRWVYAECSFEELYDGQPLADEIVAFLLASGFHLTGIGDTTRAGGRIVQADLLFEQQVGPDAIS